MIIEQFGNVDIVSGTATAGIPHAAYISEKLNLPIIMFALKVKVMVNKIKLKEQ